MRTQWPSPAKLNLFLYITGQRADGYHTLQTLFQFWITATPSALSFVTMGIFVC